MPAGGQVRSSTMTSTAMDYGTLMIGTPDLDATEWDGEQSMPNDCDVRSQQFILEQFTGKKYDELALVHDAQSHGWFLLPSGDDPGGTPMADLGALLNEHGVPVHEQSHGTVYDLANELSHGHKVIIAVDSSELWRGHANGYADHAVVVSGIDTTDSAHPMVIISDPGLPGFHSEDRYPLDQFLKAWQGSDFTYVATDSAPPPGMDPAMANFDYAQGHLSVVAGMPYDQFQSYEHQPNLFSQWLGSQPSSGMPLTPQDIFFHANPAANPLPQMLTSDLTAAWTTVDALFQPQPSDAAPPDAHLLEFMQAFGIHMPVQALQVDLSIDLLGHLLLIPSVQSIAQGVGDDAIALHNVASSTTLEAVEQGVASHLNPALADLQTSLLTTFDEVVHHSGSGDTAAQFDPDTAPQLRNPEAPPDAGHHGHSA